MVLPSNLNQLIYQPIRLIFMQETIPLITNYNSFLSFKEKMPNEHFLNKLSVIASVKVSHSKVWVFFVCFFNL